MRLVLKVDVEEAKPFVTVRTTSRFEVKVSRLYEGSEMGVRDTFGPFHMVNCPTFNLPPPGT